MNIYKLKDVIVSRTDQILPPFDMLIDSMGFEALYALSEEYGGTTLYVPTSRRLFGKCFLQAIYEEYNGRNLKLLCRKYGYCEKTIRDLVSNKV